MSFVDRYYGGCHPMTMRKFMRSIMESVLGILGNGCWMIPASSVGEMGWSQVYFGVMVLVSASIISVYT